MLRKSCTANSKNVFLINNLTNACYCQKNMDKIFDNCTLNVKRVHCKRCYL